MPLDVSTSVVVLLEPEPDFLAYPRISVYIGSAIYTASIPYINTEFGVSHVVSTLGLSLFIEGEPLIFP